MKGTSKQAGGIYLQSLPSGYSIIRNNIITGYSYGLSVGGDYSGSQVEITSNNISDNYGGIYINRVLLTTSYLIQGNAIYKNDSHNASNYESLGIDCANNWWGTTDPVAIAAKIYDKNQDFKLGTITFIPFLTSMPTDVPVLPP